MLADLGIPVEAERGRYGAYRLRPGYKLPPLIFTEDESLALTLSLLMARENGLATTDPAFEGALAKIERVLPVSTRQRIQASETFLRPANFDPLAAVQRALASVPRVWQVEVWLETTLEEAQRKSQLSTKNIYL
jgi:predicted DNA-binding transcriptional regulator YafY